MIRNLLATTAIATLEAATGAFAQDATTPAPAPADPAPMTEGSTTAAPEVSGDGHLATQIIGESIFNGTGDDAQNIGDVNDIVLGADGKIEAVVVGVGGFLGIGEKDVAVDFAQLEWAERDGDRWLVALMTKEQPDEAAFDRSAYEPEQPVASNDPAATTPSGRRRGPASTLPPRLRPRRRTGQHLRLTQPQRLRPQAEPAAPAPGRNRRGSGYNHACPGDDHQAWAEPAPADQMAENPAPADPAAPAPTPRR